MLEVFKYFNKKQKLFIGISLIFIIVQVWLDLKLPDYMSNITRLAQTEGSKMSDILLQGVYMLLCAIGSMIVSMIVGYFASMVAAGLAKTLRGMVFDKTISFSMEEINRFSTSSLINRCTNDVTQIQTLVSMGLQVIIKSPILAIWAVVKISGKNWQWSVATVLAVLILMIMLALTLIIAVPRFRKIQGLTDDLNRVTSENLSGIRVVRAYNAESYQEKKFDKVNDELTNTNLVANRVMAIMSPGMTLINSGLSLAVYWIGAYLIEATHLNNKINLFSDMVVFSNYAMQVIMAFMLLIMIFILLPRAQVSAKRVSEVINTPIKIKDGIKKAEDADKCGFIEFKNVSFAYPDAGGYVLKNISFKVKKGETVAFIGSTGSGKSTLINLIPRFFDVTEGEVLVNDINVKEYQLLELRNILGYVSQKTMIFGGTVSSNVGYGDNGMGSIENEDIKRAIEISQGKEFVEKMDGTYGARIAQGGSNVSGGQKQRLSIARAVCRNPQIFIFDDSFSALDYKTDRELRKRLKVETKDATYLMVAQRIGTIKNADKIIVLDQGKIVGQGTHEKLMEVCKTYQEIAYSQLTKEELCNE